MARRCSHCSRDAESPYAECCSTCKDFGQHSPECNKRTWGEATQIAEYFDDPQAGEKIIARIHKTLAMCSVVHNELAVIGEAGQRFVPNYRNDIEMLLAHLHVDILYCEAALRKLLGK